MGNSPSAPVNTIDDQRSSNDRRNLTSSCEDQLSMSRNTPVRRPVSAIATTSRETSTEHTKSRFRDRLSNLRNAIRPRGSARSRTPTKSQLPCVSSAPDSLTPPPNRSPAHDENLPDPAHSLETIMTGDPVAEAVEIERLRRHASSEERHIHHGFVERSDPEFPYTFSINSQDGSGNGQAHQISPTSTTPSDTSAPSLEIAENADTIRPSVIPQRRSLAAPENSDGRRVTRSRYSADPPVQAGPVISDSPSVPQSGEMVSPMPGEDQAAMLSRLLSVAAAATAASLVGHNNTQALRSAHEVGFGSASSTGARTTGERQALAATDQPNEMTAAENEASELVDGSFDGFLSALQSGRLAQALRNGGNAIGSDVGTIGPHQPLNFFRMFRFSTPVSINGASSSLDNESQMVPIIIVGIRSVPPREDGSFSDTMPPFFETLSAIERDEPRDSGTIINDLDSTSSDIRDDRTHLQEMNGMDTRDRSSEERSRSTEQPLRADSRTSFRSLSTTRSNHDASGAARSMSGIMDSVLDRLRSFRTETTGPEALDTSDVRRRRRRPAWRPFSNSSTVSGEAAGNGSNHTRSWIIYVLGGTYPENHPILTTPSLFTDTPTYEDMLMLSNLIGPAKPETADTDDIDSAGTSYSLGMSNTELQGHCLICISDFEIGDICRKLTKCSHYFHRDCIDEWLITGRNTCPCCRERTAARNKSILPSGSTGGSNTGNSVDSNVYSA